MPLSPSSSSSFVSFRCVPLPAHAPPCSSPRCPLHQQLSKPLCRRRHRRRRRRHDYELDIPTTCVTRDANGNNSYNNSNIAEDVDDEQASSSNAVSIWTRLRAAVPLSQVFADHLGRDALHPVGSTAASQNKFKVICPFHNDRNPSLHIDDSLGLFHCFACGAKGSVIDFEQLIGGHRSVSTALRSLSSKYPPIAAVLRNSVSLSNVSSSSSPSSSSMGMNVFPILNGNGSIVRQPVEKPRVSRRARLTQKAIVSDVLRDALPAFTAALWDSATPDGLSYLRHQRGLSDPTLRAFQCGFVPPHPKRAFILSHLHAHGHAPDDVVLAGIARAVTDDNKNNSENNVNPNVTDIHDNPTKRRFYDVFRNRVVFPIRDIEGTVLSFAARSLPRSASFAREPKYINGADSPLFSKRSVLFGADLAVAAHSATVDEGFVILVEGYLDAMAVFDRTQGRVACVASMGTALSHDQLRAACGLLSDKVDGKVIINFDADDAGTRAVERLCDVVIPQVPDCAHAIHIAFLPPPFKDADDMLARLQNQQQHGANFDGGSGIQSVGSNGSDEYIDTVLIGAVPWCQWRGDRIVQHELARMDEEEDGNDQQQQRRGRQKNVAAGEALLSPSSTKSMAELEAALDLVDDETEFNVLMSDFLRDQHDDFALAFGAKAEDLNKSSISSEVLPPQCSDAVLDQLGQVIARATECMPWLNAAALAQVWADSLSYSTPRVLVTLCKRILNKAEQYAEPWAEHSLPVQMYWMPPPPWVLAELPAWKRKSMGYGQEWIPPVEEDVDNATAFTLDDVDLDDDTVGSADTDPFNEGIGDNGTDGDDDDGKYRLSEDTKFMKRSMRRLEAQQGTVVPLLQARQSDRAKRLTLAPRRSAEEIILRCLIFANETDRLTALQKLLDVIIRCGQTDLPFWTCAKREQVFEYLVALQGSPSVDEMAAYLEEFDWFTAEIDDLFVAVEDETDLEWREIRELEISAPVQLVHATAHSVETMATKVARRMALDASNRVLRDVIDTRARLDEEGGGDENASQQLEEEMRLLCETQDELARQLDGSKFLTEEQVRQKETEARRAQRRIELEKQQKMFWEEMEAVGEVEAPGCVDGDAVELFDDDDDDGIAGFEY